MTDSLGPVGTGVEMSASGAVGPDARSDADAIPILPFSYIVGQNALRDALAWSFVEPSIGGVLVSGERGTAKSTTVRSFARMVYGELPVTLPINATDDRVIGGWRIESLLAGEAVQQPGLLKRAGEQGILYVDEVNLLDDHIVNIILDTVSTGVLTAQREGLDSEGRIAFGLVGTMNPEEGGLRPQLLDRFGLLVPVSAESDAEIRAEILFSVLRFTEEVDKPRSEWLEEGRRLDDALRVRLVSARERRREVVVSRDIVRLCGRIAAEFAVAGHRGEITMLSAARAVAAIERRGDVTPEDVQLVAPYAILHRRPQAGQGADARWTAEDEERLKGVIGRAPRGAA